MRYIDCLLFNHAQIEMYEFVVEKKKFVQIALCLKKKCFIQACNNLNIKYFLHLWQFHLYSPYIFLLKVWRAIVGLVVKASVTRDKPYHNQIKRHVQCLAAMRLTLDENSLSQTFINNDQTLNSYNSMIK